MTIGENFFRRYQSADYQAIHTLENTLVSNFRLYLVNFFLGFVFLCVDMVSIYVYKWMIILQSLSFSLLTEICFWKL